MKQIYLTKNPTQTKKVGIILAEKILGSYFHRKKAVIFGLKGDLGGGKTTFLQGFARGLKIKSKILSPTFVLMKRFEIPFPKKQQKYGDFYHIDCYRTNSSKEISDLGFQEIISEPKNIIAIEWAEKISEILPENTIWIKFIVIDKNTRKILFN